MTLTEARDILRDPAYHDRAIVRRAAIFVNAIDLVAEPQRETLVARRMLGRIADHAALHAKTAGG
jgi:hypothetical protein